jgi:hypothetical protein
MVCSVLTGGVACGRVAAKETDAVDRIRASPNAVLVSMVLNSSPERLGSSLSDRTVQSNMGVVLKNKMTEPFGHRYVITIEGGVSLPLLVGIGFPTTQIPA